MNLNFNKLCWWIPRGIPLTTGQETLQEEVISQINEQSARVVSHGLAQTNNVASPAINNEEYSHCTK